MTSYVDKIHAKCKAKKIDITLDFVDFLVSLVPGARNRQQCLKDCDKFLDRIVAVIKQRCSKEDSPGLLTLKTQCYFIKNYYEIEVIIEKHRCGIKNKTASLVQEICEESELNNKKEIEKLYQKMLVVITVVSALGDPTVPEVLREVAIALQSVLQPSELPRYVTLSKQKKEEQLMDLVLIVTGIRLFNRDCERGGAGIDDLPSILQVALDKTHTTIIEFLEMLMEKVYFFTAAVEVGIQSRKLDDSNTKRLPETVVWSIEMLGVLRQQEIYVRKLLSDVEICEEEIRSLIGRLQKGLMEIHEAVKFRTAIPTSQVYPKFIEIAHIWLKLQDQVIALSHVNEILSELKNLFPKSLITKRRRSSVDKLLINVKILNDAERLELTMGKSIAGCGNCEIAYPTNDTSFDNMNIQFLGFCTYCFIAGDGALIPGNPNIGVVVWGGKYFAFSQAEFAAEFGRDPLHYLKSAYSIIRKHTEYIHLFQLYDDIQSILRRDLLTDEDLTLCVRRNQEMQTEMHVFPVWIDKDYSPSIWEYRRQALQWANIALRATRSTQTYASHYRNGVSIQTLRPKEKEAQTNKNVSTNTSKLKKYILRLPIKQCKTVQCFDFSYPIWK